MPWNYVLIVRHGKAFRDGKIRDEVVMVKDADVALELELVARALGAAQATSSCARKFRPRAGGPHSFPLPAAVRSHCSPSTSPSPTQSARQLFIYSDI